MAAKRWKLVVTDLGGGMAPSEVTTEGDNWMQALTNGRRHLGESDGVPPGASCVPAADGGATVLDPASRRRYVLTPLTASDPSPAGAPAAAPKRSPKRTVAYVPGDQAPPPPPTQPNKKKFSSKTVAYVPDDQAPPPPPAQPNKKKFSSKTVAYVPGDEAPPAPPTREVAVENASQPAVPPAPAPPADPPADPPAAPRAELLSSRDQDPTPETPLCYRERSLVVPEGTPRSQAEGIARTWFEDLRRAHADQPDGKFFCVSVFDHRWDERPERPPLVTLQWKDWRGEPQVQFPEVAPTPRPRRISRPPADGSAPADEDPRLAQAFDACHDLLFLASSEEVVRFVVRLLTELVPTEASAGLLLDVATDALRVVATEGVGADAFRGRTLSRAEGLCAAAMRGCVRVDHVHTDERFMADREGRPGLTVLSALYVPLIHQGRYVGALQLLNRTGAPGFSEADEKVAAYVAGAATEALS